MALQVNKIEPLAEGVAVGGNKDICGIVAEEVHFNVASHLVRAELIGSFQAKARVLRRKTCFCKSNLFAATAMNLRTPALCMAMTCA
jgi:hypothetical protein